ncbi:(2Fe-2S) ferredoxin domain-containing protein [Magnetovibrio sp. PR-2]|uniref:(2Fe-2S) ferredoxin domain-containing protein n=1 Tax=Magnetovibrio sp. PR-2 TaxID=3120356 RepID=UPI002FCE3791
MSNPQTTLKPKVSVFVCTNLRMSGNSCAGSQSKALLKAMQDRADARTLDDHPLISVKESVCMGYCGEGPNVKIIGGDFYHEVELDQIDAILDDAEKLASAKS